MKFLYAVEKTDAHDTKQALDLLARWASVDVADALILLSDDFTHEPTIPSPLDDAVRRFAVQTLRKSASDADLRLYLLQLVQALRHEPDLKALQQRQQEQQEQQASTVVATDGSGGELASETPSAAENPSAADEPESLSPLADLLLERCVNNEELSNFFHWFVEVETHAHGVGELYSLVLRAFHNRLAVSNRMRGSMTCLWPWVHVGVLARVHFKSRLFFVHPEIRSGCILSNEQ